jgi:hypothetical protein
MRNDATMIQITICIEIEIEIEGKRGKSCGGRGQITNFETWNLLDYLGLTPHGSHP